MTNYAEGFITGTCFAIVSSGWALLMIVVSARLGKSKEPRLGLGTRLPVTEIPHARYSAVGDLQELTAACERVRKRRVGRVRPLAVLLLAVLLCAGCATERLPHAKSVPMGGKFYRIDGRDWVECWMEVRYLIGREKAFGVTLWNDSEDKTGAHLMVRLMGGKDQ